MYNPIEIFASMCTRINDCVNRQKLIQDNTLFDFSKATTYVIQNLPETMPSSYNMLHERIQDYWLYEIDNDHEKRRISNYTRIFQVVMMIQIAIIERDKQRRVLRDLEHNVNKYQILKKIHATPGLASTTLHVSFGIPYEEIFLQTSELTRDGYILIYTQGPQQFYILTNLGEKLFLQLKESIGDND